jgi:hypothetical protein
MDVRVLILLALCSGMFLSAGAWAQSLVYNGSFDEAAPDGRPAGWETAGTQDIEQTMAAVRDPQRGRVARLDCTRFVPGSPSSHVMAAQLGRVGVERDRWYSLSLWARASDLQGSAVQVALVNRIVWGNAGLEGAFLPTATWQRFEFPFRARQDLKPEDSRLQIWFGSTGTLWLDDVEIVPGSEPKVEWRPALPLEGVKNAIPNSSFECGGAGWGCWTPNLPAQVFRLMGEQDGSRAFHGAASWKLALRADDLPRLYRDYYEPADVRVRCLMLGHDGWVPVEPGKRYVFSAYVSADRAGLPGGITVREGRGRRHELAFTAGEEWTRVELPFTAESEFACGFVGLDLRRVDPPDGTLWVDAVQFEAGERATPYEPRRPLEAFVEMQSPSGIFTGSEVSYRLKAYNDSDRDATLRGKLEVTDYRDEVVSERAVQASVGTHAASSQATVLSPWPLGFFRVHWAQENALPQKVRCARIKPYADADSMFGMNHAFGSEFMLERSHLAGVKWWRDWSDQWQWVQPRQDGFDFSVPDAQIDRVLSAGGLVDVLFPFPSSYWSARVDRRQIEDEAGGSSYVRARLQAAYKPEDVSAFARYVRASVEHYRDRIRVYEVLNEPLFTNYALPERFGYRAEDYVEMLRAAYQAAKEADPDCLVIGGIATDASSDRISRFIEAGGLKWCDATNYHSYPHKGWAESYEPALKARWEQMQARGEARPVWYTEFGLYADDDPPTVPYRAGDTTMNNTIRPNELAAAADIVRFAAVFGAYGVVKVFYHAGTQAGLHDSTAGNVFFEYGGAPRKQYAAQAALSDLLGPDARFVRKWDEPEWVRAYEFRSRGRTVVILWTRRADAPPLALPEGLSALDLMGNPLPGRQVVPGEVPIYLVSLVSEPGR